MPQARTHHTSTIQDLNKALTRLDKGLQEAAGSTARAKASANFPLGTCHEASPALPPPPRCLGPFHIHPCSESGRNLKAGLVALKQSISHLLILPKHF